MSDTQSQEQDKPTATPRRFARGQRTHDCHLVKLLLSKYMRNTSWKWRQPSFNEVEHVHFYRSLNDTTMQPNKYCSPVGGHFHEVKVDFTKKGKNGGPLVTCGPPLKYVMRKGHDGVSQRRITTCTFETFPRSQPGEVEDPTQKAFELVEDKHTHDYEYFGSEEFTEKGKNEARLQEKEKVKDLMTGQPVSRQPGAQTGLNEGPDKDRVRGNIKEQ